MAEYNALLIRMQFADEIGVKNLEAYGDSKLIVSQVRGEYEARHEDLVPYYNATIHMAKRFSNCLLYTSPSPRDRQKSRMPSSA